MNKKTHISLHTILFLLVKLCFFYGLFFYSTSIAYAYGTIIVNISPKEAIDDGAEWRTNTFQYWRPSGYPMRHQPGHVIIEYKDIDGWITPPRETVTIEANDTITVTATYEKIITGLLRVKIEPEPAAKAGATWKRMGGMDYFLSNQTEEDIPIGKHYVDFSLIPGWSAPDLKEVEITEDELTDITVRYEWDLHDHPVMPEEMEKAFHMINYLEYLYPETFPNQDFQLIHEGDMLFKHYKQSNTFAGSYDGYLWTYLPQFENRARRQGKIQDLYSEFEELILEHKSERNVVHTLDTVKLLDFLEIIFPEILPRNGLPFRDWMLYFRYYQDTEIYLGSFERKLWIYLSQDDDLQELGRLEEWLIHVP